MDKTTVIKLLVDLVLASILLIVLTVAWDQVPRFFLPLGAPSWSLHSSPCASSAEKSTTDVLELPLSPAQAGERAG